MTNYWRGKYAIESIQLPNGVILRLANQEVLQVIPPSLEEGAQ
jgi:hypothetical protein